MSLRETIQVVGRLEMDQYLHFLQTERHAKEHPSQSGAYLVDGLPFYEPQQEDGYVFIMGFNMQPLPLALIETLIEHPEIASEDTQVRWTQEQELVFEGDIRELRKEHP
jgi:hypothetical protein